MTKTEFWTLFNQKYKNNLRPGVYIQDKPVGGDGGCFVYGCFQNEKGIWCIEETKERSNTPYHREFESEEKAFERFLSLLHSHSTLDEFYIKQQKERLERFENSFHQQINGPDHRYVYRREFPPLKTGEPNRVYTWTCYLTDWKQWYVEQNKAGQIIRTYHDNIEDAKKILLSMFV